MDVKKILEVCTDEAMSLVELKEDPVFFKIPKDMIKDYIKTCEDIAKEKTLCIKKYYGNKELLEICRDKGIKVNIYDKEYRVMNIKYRAEIYYTRNEINIMKPSIELMFNELKKFNLTVHNNKKLEIDDVINIHVAHELYHFLEYKDGKDTGDLLPKVTNFKIGRFEKTSKVVKSSEIAAHRFCKEYLELPFHPKVLDYLYLINSGEISEADLFNYIDELKGLIN